MKRKVSKTSNQGSLGPQGPCVHREPNSQLPSARAPYLKQLYHTAYQYLTL